MAENDNLPVPPPSRLDRAALERVLARAASLQATDADPSEPALSEDQLVEIGKEVGLSPQHLRQALAEERGRQALPDEEGSLAHVFGAALVHASRTVRGRQEDVLRSLDAWMQAEESLRVKRRFADRMLWEPRPGFVTEMRRALNVGGRGYYLSRAHEVSATVVPVDEGRVLVRLEANIANVRTQRLAGGGAVAGFGALGSATLIVLGVFVPIAIVPAGAALVGGYFVARSHRPVVVRAQLALEQILDRLERGESPRAGLLGTLAQGMTNF
ncbi:MAG: hypothetical protein ACREOJ_08170 [Gemmatimonadaceae bacterium]